MQHLSIAGKITILTLRSSVLQATRQWFSAQGFLEIEAPILVQHPGMEPYLSPVPVTIHTETGLPFQGHLITSPEYTMKKCLAAGMKQIFCLGKVFRDYESFGGAHNPEFTMLEWYRANADMTTLMNDVEAIIAQAFHVASKPMLGVNRIHMNDLWEQYAGLSLNDLLLVEQMRAVCLNRGFVVEQNESYEDLFYRIFLNEIEPKLPTDCVTIIHHYPAQMAALAKLSDTDPRYAERFEVYVGSVELANAFTELTDASEQRKRLEAEQLRRKQMGKPVFSLDEDFLAAVAGMPPSAGIAFGFDRLMQLMVEAQDINDTLVLSAKSLFKG